MALETVMHRAFDRSSQALPLGMSLGFESAPPELGSQVGGVELDQGAIDLTVADAALSAPEIGSVREGDDGHRGGSGSDKEETPKSISERDVEIFGDRPPSNGNGSPVCVKSAATKLQKVYRSYRTRRRLADSAVVAEELWWQAIDYTRLNHSTVSFFNYLKPETPITRWNRVSLIASKVGKGLSKDEKALKLAFQHWIEAIDPRHRYGHNLHIYYEEWCKSQAGEPFFYWLDPGAGKNVDFKECPRSLLQQQRIRYLGPQEREHYEYIPIEGKIIHKQTGEFLDTSKDSGGAKWIFVVSTSKKLYAGQKIKGVFHHSSFLAGGATLAAGRFTAENGMLKSIWAYSGHYRPSEENLKNFLSFLQGSGVDTATVQIRSSSNEDYYDDTKQIQAEQTIEEAFTVPKPPQLVLPPSMVKNGSSEPTAAVEETGEIVKDEPKGLYKRTLSGGLQSPKPDVPQKAIYERIKSKSEASSYQLGHQLSFKWSSGAGPRIGCVKDYPLELRQQALEFVNLSPRPPTPSSSRRLACCVSPTSPILPTGLRQSDINRAEASVDNNL